jgi:hypothetical protein
VDIGITSIQRDRGPWIVEWLAFHMLVGFNRFYLYSHKCCDGMTATLLKLAEHYPIQVHELDIDELPQLAAYQHSVVSYLPTVDWMAFVDGDEFLFPTAQGTMAEALAPFEPLPLSAVAVYWKIYGSNGHVDEPGGLLIEKFPRHSNNDFEINRHVKSILRGRQPVKIHGSHVFQTENGTYDELLRPINQGWMKELEPSYKVFRLNHYAVQSFDFFKKSKQNMGAADADSKYVRPDGHFFVLDRNECDDGAMYNFIVPLKLKVRELNAVLSAN